MPNLLQDKLDTLDEEQVAKLYQTVFQSGEGQLVLEDLRNRCYIYTTTSIGMTDYDRLYEGMRTVVLHIQTQLNYEKPEVEGIT